ncbi:MAG: chemotaxis protein CheA [Planctomycetales bacterium]|nr:chemotaxis protein CheA [Planctomycetales bacterium]
MTTETTTGENTAELIADFVDEAVESIRAIPSQLTAARTSPTDDGPINAVFRSVHSIKGCAGFLGLNAVKVFSHRMENTMDEVRKEKVELSEDLERALVHGVDLLEVMLQRAVDGEVATELLQEESAAIAEIEAIANACRSELEPEEQLLEELRALAVEVASANVPGADEWAQRINAIVEAAGAETDTTEESTQDPAPTPGTIEPAATADQPFQCAGEDVTEFVRKTAAIFLLEKSADIEAHAPNFLAAIDEFAAWAAAHQQPALHSTLTAAATDFRTIADSPLDLDASLLSVVWDRLRVGFAPLAVQAKTSPESAPTEKSPAEPKQSSDTTSKPETNATNAGASSNKSRLLRIHEDTVDEFLGDVSSLFITGELLKDLYSRFSKEDQAATLVEELRQITTMFNEQSASLQKSVVALRRVPISGLFSKVPRMARTLASQLGKKVDVHLNGETEEVDKSLIEDLDAPLTHMVRNCMDHGIDTPEERLGRGVSEVGNIWLDAEVTRTHVIVSIRDDGRGIDVNRLRAKSVDRGLYSPEEAAALTHEEALRLIFHAGLSTAEKLSDVSGRGVGMDVVLTNLREHNGEIFVESELGVGTTIRMEIPIREAVLVIDGLMCQEAEDTFVIPFENVIEITEITTKRLTSVHGSLVARVRDKTYAAVRLGDVLGLEVEPAGEDRTLEAILVGAKTGEACLLVDRVCGHRQIVLNSMSNVLPGVKNIAGVAQLGSGRLALVLQIDDMIESLRH